VKSPLEFAPRPDSIARRLFNDATIEVHLDALEAGQHGVAAEWLSWY
jgi:hypothetical protein